MAALGLKEGEWFHASKPALRAGMRPTFELKARVWCCGILHTQSYQGECAMTKFRNKIIPLSPAAIAKELRDEALEFYAAAGKVLTKDQEKALNVRRQHVRRVLVELERESLAERRTADGTRLRDLSPDELKRLPIGRIRLYFFLRPLPSKTVPDVAINGYVSFAFLSPRESRLLNKVLQRFELEPEPYVAGEGYVQETVKVAIAGYVERNNVALQDYRKAKDVAAQTLKKALDVAISSERIVRNPVSNLTVRREVPAPAREAPPVSEAPVRKATSSSSISSTHDDDASRPVPEFSAAVTATFVTGKRPAPTEGQLRDLLKAIPDESIAREMFIPYLAEKMPRLQHPGSLPSVAREFTAAWPVLKAQAEAAAEVEAAAQAHRSEIERECIAEAEVDERVVDTWEQMSIAEKEIRLKAAAQILRPEPRWKLITEQQRKQEMERYARATLKTELQEGVSANARSNPAS
jgi:hypothetical protein